MNDRKEGKIKGKERANRGREFLVEKQVEKKEEGEGGIFLGCELEGKGVKGGEEVVYVIRSCVAAKGNRLRSGWREKRKRNPRWGD